jgi:hypothetical protein
LRVRFVSLALSLILVAWGPQVDELPQLGIDISETSVSGLSAGAYMAGQLQVAHSSHIVGAGVVAGGPFGCAETPGSGLMPARSPQCSEKTRLFCGCRASALLPVSH